MHGLPNIIGFSLARGTVDKKRLCLFDDSMGRFNRLKMSTLNQPLLKEVGYTIRRANWDPPLTTQPNLNLMLFTVLYMENQYI